MAWMDATIINSTRHNGDDGSLSDELRLAWGEYITHVFVRSGNLVEHVEFITK